MRADTFGGHLVLALSRRTSAFRPRDRHGAGFAGAMSRRTPAFDPGPIRGERPGRLNDLTVVPTETGQVGAPPAHPRRNDGTVRRRPSPSRPAFGVREILRGVAVRPGVVIPLGVVGALGTAVALGTVVAPASVSLTGDTVPFVVGPLLVLLVVAGLAAVVAALNRVKPESTRRLVLAGASGSGGAVVLTGIMSIRGLGMLGIQEGILTGPGVGLYPTIVRSSFAEEFVKAVVLFGLLWLARREVNGPTDGIIYAAAVGGGFALVESALSYAVAAYQSGGTALAATFVVRRSVTPLAHALFASVAGMAFGCAVVRRGTGARVVVPLLGFVGAVALHILWEAAATTNLLRLAFYYAMVFLPVFGFVVVVTLLDRRRMVRLVSRYLPQYGRYDLVTPADVRMLSSLRSRRYARTWGRAHGRHAWRGVRDYQRAATELALLEHRVQRGFGDPYTTPRRRESLLRRMGTAREAYLRLRAGNQQPPHPPWSEVPPPGPGSTRK